MKPRILSLALLTLAAAAAAAAAGNCNYPSMPANANAQQRAAHQQQLINGASDQLKQYCANAAQAKGGSYEACLIFRGYMRELCAGTDNGFPLLVDQKFVTADEFAALTKVMPAVKAQ